MAPVFEMCFTPIVVMVDIKPTSFAKVLPTGSKPAAVKRWREWLTAFSEFPDSSAQLLPIQGHG